MIRKSNRHSKVSACLKEVDEISLISFVLICKLNLFPLERVLIYASKLLL